MIQNRSVIKILDVNVDNITLRESVRVIEDLIKEKDKSKPHHVTTVNPEFIVAANKDAKFKEILNNADLSIPDGAGIVWAAKILDKNLQERIAGVDLVEELARESDEKGFKIMFFGGEKGIAEQTIECLRTKYPKMNAFSDSGPLKVEEEQQKERKSYLERIKSINPDILLVAFGHPKQEKWIAENMRELNVPVLIGVGGAFNYLSGKSKRPAKWIQDIGLEWLYRLIKEPYRLRRQLALIKFIFLILKEKLNPIY